MKLLSPGFARVLRVAAAIAALNGAVAAKAQLSEWTSQFGTARPDQAVAVASDSSGAYVVGAAGGVLPGSTSSGGSTAFLRRFAADGQVVWTRQFEGSATGVALDSSAVYVSAMNSPGLSVRRYDLDGNLIWDRRMWLGVVLVDDCKVSLSRAG